MYVYWFVWYTSIQYQRQSKYVTIQIFQILDPVGLLGEGRFNLLSLKEINATDSFMGLHRDTRNCQNIETYDDCKTRLYIEKLRQECGCLPLSLRLSDKV